MPIPLIQHLRRWKSWGAYATSKRLVANWPSRTTPDWTGPNSAFLADGAPPFFLNSFQNRTACFFSIPGKDYRNLGKRSQRDSTESLFQISGTDGLTS